MEDTEELQGVSEEGHQELLAVVMTLPEEFRSVTVLFYYERFSIVEIGRILQVPEGTVKSRLHRAKQMLREKL
ncbi:MAG: sigma-70 family RNA polymerase sigma factor [Lachnospiraceae bacterium]|nr:sigma-70 family RNA polymerase sigma factor [Lachnospiraceae bacterium]